VAEWSRAESTRGGAGSSGSSISNSSRGVDSQI